MSLNAENIYSSILNICQEVKEKEMDNIRRASKLLAERLLEDGIIHVFGAGHSRSFGMEMCGRAGGLAPMKLVGLEDIAARDNDSINLVELERSPKTANRLLEIHDVHPEDAFLIVSNSGRNGSSVELALECKNRGIPVIAVTSLKHSKNTTSRHHSGKKLYEVADIVIDNHCPYGDVLLEIPKYEFKTGSASTVVGTLIAQSLTVEIINLFLESNQAPPVFISANVDGGDEHNKNIIKKYEKRNITY
ncbi:SIS domain-containing protein [Bacillus sp. JJ1533]|uniref:SIS domain-containing protein n=1 Tax=Bacillus sp. JJ1533 TaxID=3122959 RepID=UPI00300000B9